MNDLNNYIDKYNQIENNLNNNIYINKDILIDLKNDIHHINNQKELVNKLKSLMIKINKSNNIIIRKKNLEKYINKYIHLLNNNSIQHLNVIQNNYEPYLNINYDELNSKIENIIIQNSKFELLDFYSIINAKKFKKNNLQKLITSSNPHNSYLPKTIFLEHFDNIESEKSIVTFLNKFNFNYIEKNNKTLKRGFIFQMINQSKTYFIKFQPNKSFIEIIMNKYLSKYNQFKNLILFPEYIFINKNNSYFYIIQKYNCDLLKFLKISPSLNIHSIFKIIHFITHIVFLMHNIDIIYGDVKLENIVINHDNFNIIDMKLIDFDVSLFDAMPNEFKHFDDKILNLLKNKKPRGTKIYMSKNKYMEKSNDIYSIGVFIIILLYKNLFKLFNENDNIVSEDLKSKIIKKLNYFKNNIDNDNNKKKLMKYIFRIFNDKRFNHLWKHKISIKKLYTIVKNCIDQNIDAKQLYHQINYL